MSRRYLVKDQKDGEEVMNKKNSRRVVIIEDIDSNTIEQAIFILRNNGSAEKSERGTIVREAERIINAYVQTMAKAQVGISRKENRCRREKGGKGTSAMIGIACLVLAGILVLFLKGTGI